MPVGLAAARNAEWQRTVVGDLGRAAILRGMQGRPEEALVLSGEAVDLATRIAEEDPDNFEAQRNVAQLRNRRTVDLVDLGRLDEAEQSARAGLAGVEALLARDPTNVTVETLVGEGHQALGEALLARAHGTTDSARWRAARAELVVAVGFVDRLIARGVLAKGLGEANEADSMRVWIAECDRILAGKLASLGRDGKPVR